MDRREFTKVAGAAATIPLLAGCSDAVSEVTGGLDVTGMNARTTTFGNIELTAQVENTASDSKSGTLVGQVDLEGGDTFTEQKAITVGANRTNSFEIGIDIPVADSLSGGQYTYDVWLD
ncbi:hypothetical protein C479_06901 [Halovivax asiaticus JCM 14624]|uniref:Uncharacterized protein n=1 Tax=Halovivax asiaticus JCM 14624 TaxID=1227490 RepID=M0BM80_9EURY|nr:hypothetical protein [Halovivax asiaticus]ELZ11572.1 hypothetical protein C479_06901 [Halovivax asiaticus JCM 14624]